MLVYRDLGGIKNKEGKVIKNNMIARGKSLYKLKNKDIQKLKTFNLAKIIDLRTAVEIDEKPNVKIDNITTGRSTGYHLHFETRYGTTGGFWAAKRKEPLYLIEKSTIPSQLYAQSDAGCPDKNDWGM